MSDKEIAHLEIAKSYVKIADMCGSLIGKCENCCEGCCFAYRSDNEIFYSCYIDAPFQWSINWVKEWIKKHESEESGDDIYTSE